MEIEKAQSSYQTLSSKSDKVLGMDQIKERIKK